MTNALQQGKRALAISVALATIAWAMGLATLIAPLSARAATLTSGSLIKGSLPAVYYYGGDSKRYVFPNEKTYKTWYADFSTVQVISDAELASIQIGGNATYRPAKAMVKITTDPKVYAVSAGGTLRWVSSEAVAIALYGANWNKMIDDVPDAFFTNYKIGADIAAVSQYNTSAELAAAASINADKGLSGGAVAGAGVVVALSSKTPSTMSIPSGAFYAPMAVLEVKNNTNAEVKLTGLTVRRTGILADSNVSGLLVTNGSGALHGSLVTFGQSVAMPGFSGDPIRIPANGMAELNLNVNIATGATSGTIGVLVNGASDVTAVDSAGAAVPVSGSFPIQGNLMSVVSGTGSLGALQLSARTIIGGTSAAPVDIDQGAQNLDVAKFRLQESTGNEDVELMYIEIQNNGSASAGDYRNIRLVDQDNVVIASTDSVVNNIAKFSILNMTGAKAGLHGGFKIPNGQLRDFTIRIDTASNTNAADRTLNFTIQNDFRVRAIGQETGVGVTPAVTGADTFPLGDADAGINWAKFRSGSLTSSRATDSRSGKVAKGATNVALAAFDLRAFGEDIEVQEVAFVVYNASGAGQAVTRRALNGTLKINNAGGSTVYSETATNAGIYGTGGCTVASNAFATGTCTGVPALRTLSSFYTLKANETGKLSFVADIDQNATALDGYRVHLTSVKFRKVSSNTFTTSTYDVDGNGITVEDSNITVTRSASYNPQNLVKGGSLQKLGSFDVQAGAGEAQRINAMKVRVAVKNGAVTAIADTANTLVADLAYVSNVTLKSGDTQLAPAQNITTVAGATYSAQVEVPQNGTKTIDVFGVVSTSYPTARANLGVSLEVTSVTGVQSQTTVSKTEVIGQSILTTAGGTLAFSALGNDGTINVAKLLHASDADVSLFKFKIRDNSNAEPLSLEKLYFAAKNAQNTFASFKLFNEGTNLQVGTGATVTVTTGANGEIRFGGLGLLVPKGGEVNVVLKGTVVDASTVEITNFNVDFTPSFVEYTGTVSGSTTRESGGMAIGQGTADSSAVGTFTAGTVSTRTITVAVIPTATATLTIGACTVTFSNNADELNCIDSAANVKINDGGESTTTVANSIDALINVTDAVHGALLVGAGAATTTVFTSTGSSNTALAASVFTAGGGGANDITSASTTGVASQYIVVNDISNFEVGDLVQVDANNDGVFSAVVVSGILESFARAVKTVGSTSITLSQTALSTGVELAINGALTSGARITKYNFTSFNHQVQEVEPAIFGLNVGSGNQVSQNEVGTFAIQNLGGRSLVVNKLRFEISGSYNANGGYSPRTFRLDRADASTGSRISNTMNNGAVLGSPTLVYTNSGGVVGNAIVNGALTAGATLVTAAIDAHLATVTVGAAPATGETFTIGTCVVTFANTTANELDCTGGANVRRDTGDGNTAKSTTQLANDLDALTNVTDAAGGVLTVGAGAATTTTFLPTNSVATITLTDGTGGDITSAYSSNVSSSTLAVGDRVTFAGSTNGGVGYRLTAATTALLTFTPALQNNVADNAVIALVASGIAVGDTSVLESGQTVQFDLAGQSLVEEVPGNSAKAYVLLADTTLIKNNTSSGTTATTQIRMLGAKASPSSGTTDGLEWTYTRTSNGASAGTLTISDSYIVSGKSLLYQ